MQLVVFVLVFILLPRPPPPEKKSYEYFKKSYAYFYNIKLVGLESRKDSLVNTWSVSVRLPPRFILMHSLLSTLTLQFPYLNGSSVVSIIPVVVKTSVLNCVVITSVSVINLTWFIWEEKNEEKKKWEKEIGPITESPINQFCETVCGWLSQSRSRHPIS